jgi:hypothetical protein
MEEHIDCYIGTCIQYMIIDCRLQECSRVVKKEPEQEFGQILIVHHPPIVMTADWVVHTSTILVCWTGGGNPVPLKLLKLFHHHFPGWRRRLHYSIGTITQ